MVGSQPSLPLAPEYESGVISSREQSYSEGFAQYLGTEILLAACSLHIQENTQSEGRSRIMGSSLQNPSMSACCPLL